MATTSRSFRGVAPEERQARRRGLLLDAALDIIGTQGWARATMSAICQRAGLTERYFYESFADRDALYVELVDGIARQTTLAVFGAVDAAGPTPRDRVRAGIGALVTLFASDPRLGAVALFEGLGNERVQRRRQAIFHSFEGLVGELFERMYGPGQAVARSVAAMMVVGGVTAVLTRWLSGELECSAEELVEHVTGLVLAV